MERINRKEDKKKKIKARNNNLCVIALRELLFQLVALLASLPLNIQMRILFTIPNT